MISSRFAKTAATSSPSPEIASRTPGTAFARLNTSIGRSSVLLRVAAPVVALSTDQTILNERYGKAYGRKLPHGGHTAHPAAHDDHVEVFANFHLPSLPMIGNVGLEHHQSACLECADSIRGPGGVVSVVCGRDVVPSIA